MVEIQAVVVIISRVSIKEDKALTTITRAITMVITVKVVIAAAEAMRAEVATVATVEVDARTLITSPRSVALHLSPVVSTRLLLLVATAITTMETEVLAIVDPSKICRLSTNKMSKSMPSYRARNKSFSSLKTS